MKSFFLSQNFNIKNTFMYNINLYINQMSRVAVINRKKCKKNNLTLTCI